MWCCTARRAWLRSVFVRYQSPVPGKRGVHTGVFGLTNQLGRAGKLDDEEHRTWRAGNDWFNENVTNPTDVDPTVYDEALHPRATAWFRADATHLLERIEPYLRILAAHGVPCERIESADPGRVHYEDADQTVVDPHDVHATTSFHSAS